MTMDKEATRIGNASIGTRQRKPQLRHVMIISSVAMEAIINEFRRLDTNAYEGRCSAFDFHIRKEGTKWYVDFFNSSVNDPNAAYCGGETFNEFQDAIDFVLSASREMGLSLCRNDTTNHGS